MTKYTVLLLRPDDMLDTYMTHIHATTPADAQVAAQAELNATEGGNPEDYDVLMVIEGHHMDLKEP